MSWLNRLPTKGSHPEEILWNILNEMNLKFDVSVPEDMWTVPRGISFSIYPREIDVLVERYLAIEVQSSGKFFHDKPIRVRKDAVKRMSIEARGLTYLELWDYELRKADQVKAGKVWRPAIRSWISEMLVYAKKRNIAYQQYCVAVPDPPECFIPGIDGTVVLSRRRDWIDGV